MSITQIGIPGPLIGDWGTYQKIGEDLTSQIDGTKTTFTTAKTYLTGSLVAFLNGTRLYDEMTEVTGTTFLLSTAPFSGDTLIVDYYYTA